MKHEAEESSATRTPQHSALDSPLPLSLHRLPPSHQHQPRRGACGEVRRTPELCQAFSLPLFRVRVHCSRTVAAVFLFDVDCHPHRFPATSKRPIELAMTLRCCRAPLRVLTREPQVRRSLSCCAASMACVLEASRDRGKRSSFQLLDLTWRTRIGC